MALKAAGADRLFDGGFLNGNHWAGLIYDNSGTKTEISGNSYARVALTLASWQRDGNTRRYETNGDIIFPAPTPQAWPAITDIGLWSQATGGNPFATVTLDTATSAPQIGAQVRWVDEMVKWGVNMGGITAAGSVAMLTEGLVGGTRAVSFHSAAPSSTNRLGNSVSVTSADFTTDSPTGERRLRNNTRIATNVLTSDVATPTHVALRNGTAADATILWTATAGGSPTDPEIGDLLTVAANAMIFTFGVDSAAI